MHVDRACRPHFIQGTCFYTKRSVLDAGLATECTQELLSTAELCVCLRPRFQFHRFLLLVSGLPETTCYLGDSQLVPGALLLSLCDILKRLHLDMPLVQHVIDGNGPVLDLGDVAVTESHLGIQLQQHVFPGIPVLALPASLPCRYRLLGQRPKVIPQSVLPQVP